METVNRDQIAQMGLMKFSQSAAPDRAIYMMIHSVIVKFKCKELFVKMVEHGLDKLINASVLVLMDLQVKNVK